MLAIFCENKLPHLEYYSSETSQALRFIFQKSGDDWYLIGIARDVPTG